MHLGYIRSGKGKHVQFHASINGIDLELCCSSMHRGGDSRSALAVGYNRTSMGGGAIEPTAR